jgi:ABC-type transporter Mla maintaining outer membrane lipid asymmetry ATPase subunit MlaF
MVDKAVRIVATPDTTAAAFMMLRDGSIYFTGSADDLLMTPDPYIRAFVGTQHPAWLRALTERARQPG